MNKVYAVSDLHGQYELWLQIKEFLSPSDTLICLGDCVDRGPSGFDILIEMLDRPNTIMLKGNHEALMLQDYYTIKNHEMQIDPYSCLWFQNGGYDTYQNIISCYGTKCVDMVFREVERLPITHVDSCNEKLIILNHCGFTPGLPYDELWDRYHLTDVWPEGYDNVYIVHGHTPVQHLWRKGVTMYSKGKGVYGTLSSRVDEVVTYCSGHKIDIDLGCFATHKTCLLDLDTFEPIYFYGKDYINYENRN